MKKGIAFLSMYICLFSGSLIIAIINIIIKGANDERMAFVLGQIIGGSLSISLLVFIPGMLIWLTGKNKISKFRLQIGMLVAWLLVSIFSLVGNVL